MSIASHKATVRQYFEEVLDKRKLDVPDEIVAVDCVRRRPETQKPTFTTQHGTSDKLNLDIRLCLEICGARRQLLTEDF
jgi:hypothetical protein